MSGINPEQLLKLAVRPVLDTVALGGRRAEMIVMGTAAVESHLVWLKQVGGGPALGFWQMEPPTFYDLIKRYPAWMMREGADVEVPCDPATVAWNLKLGALMCRLKYRDAKPELPAEWDVAAMEVYHKRYYNSALGATRPGEFTRAWNDLIAPGAGRMWP